MDLLKRYNAIIIFTYLLFVFSGCTFLEDRGNPDDPKHSSYKKDNYNYSYTVTFDSQYADVDADPASITVESPATVVDPLPEEPVRNGFAYAGWWTRINGEGTEFTIATPVTADITVFASWSANPVYTVTYNSGGGTAVGEQHVTIPATTVAALPAPPVKPGYNFGGWYTDTPCSGTEFTADTAVSADITVTACWESYSYTVTFDSVGSDSGDPADKTVASPETTIDALPTAPTKTGFDFAGWSTEENGGGELFSAGTDVTGDMTVYAMWSTIGLAFEDISGTTDECYVSAGSVTTGSVTIPGYWNGKKVTSTKYRGFKDLTGLTHVTIPGSATEIYSETFYDCTGLTGITIPEGVTTIGTNAFLGCTGLTSVIFPDSLIYIGSSAFMNCNSLTSVYIPAGVTSLIYPFFFGDGTNAFAYCPALTSITVDPDNEDFSSVAGVLFSKDYKTLILYPQAKAGTQYSIPSVVTAIGDFAFRGCTTLTKMTIPNSVTLIGKYAFNVCTGLGEISIPGGVTSIGESAFSGCTALDSEVTIPAGVTIIPASLFDGCSLLPAVIIQGEITSIGGRAFMNCSLMTGFEIPSTVTSIDQNAFYNCGGLTSVTIPAGVSTIRSESFRFCSGITSLTISSGVTFIESNAFRSCGSIASLTIPDTINTISNGAFQSCTSLKNLTMERMTPPSLGTSPFSGVTGCTLHIHSEAAAAYNEEPWRIEDGIFSTIDATLP